MGGKLIEGDGEGRGVIACGKAWSPGQFEAFGKNRGNAALVEREKSAQGKFLGAALAEGLPPEILELQDALLRDSRINFGNETSGNYGRQKVRGLIADFAFEESGLQRVDADDV